MTLNPLRVRRGPVVVAVPISTLPITVAFDKPCISITKALFLNKRRGFFVKVNQEQQQLLFVFIGGTCPSQAIIFSSTVKNAIP